MDTNCLQEEVIGNDKSFKFLLNVVDKCTKFAFSYPIAAMSGGEILRCLRHLFSNPKNIPKTISTDNDSEFCNAEIKSLLEELKIKHVRGESRVPQD